MGYQDTLLALAGEAETAAIGLWQRITDLGDDLFSGYLAALLGLHNARAASLAATAFSAQASVAIGAAVPVALRDLLDRDLGRLTKASITVIEVARDSPTPEKIIGRLARAEPLKTASDTYAEQVATSELVEGWTRGLDPDPCQLCRWWSRDGRVWPKAHPFPRHTGCACVPIPVWRKDIKETLYTKQRRAS